MTKKPGNSTQGLPPGKEDLAWVTNTVTLIYGTVTLIYGERDAILVDTFLSVQHSKELLDWVTESGKNLTTIYITHAHGDHYLGLKVLLDRFPKRLSVCHRFRCCGDAKQDKAGIHKLLLGAALAWPSPSQSAVRRPKECGGICRGDNCKTGLSVQTLGRASAFAKRQVCQFQTVSNRGVRPDRLCQL